MPDNSENEKMAKDINGWLKIIPVAGWLYILVGLIYPFENILFKLVWWIDIGLCVGLHSLQLFVALPIGRRAGHSDKEIIINTLIYGALWWQPLKKKI